MRFLVHALAAGWLLSVTLVQAAGPTGYLNDTGQTRCYNDSNNAVTCNSSGVGSDTGTNPRQDARFGRDAAAAAGKLTKTGGGAAGFDFTALDADGNATTPGFHACVKDNVTNLIWSVETLSPMNWDTAGTTATSYSRCSFTSGWRVPTRRELLSIVHYGTSNPAIDTTYFPGTGSSYYWSSDVYAPNAADAWVVNFYDGDALAVNKSDSYRVRLVRSGE